MKLQLLYGTDFNRKLLIHDQFFFLKIYRSFRSSHLKIISPMKIIYFVKFVSKGKCINSQARHSEIKSDQILSIHRQWPITGYVCLWICTKLHLTRVKKCHLDTSIIIKHRFKSEVRVISKLFPIKLQLMSV